jgi:hypothetical protein
MCRYKGEMLVKGLGEQRIALAGNAETRQGGVAVWTAKAATMMRIISLVLQVLLPTKFVETCAGT